MFFFFNIHTVLRPIMWHVKFSPLRDYNIGLKMDLNLLYNLFGLIQISLDKILTLDTTMDASSFKEMNRLCKGNDSLQLSLAAQDSLSVFPKYLAFCV